MIVSLDGAPDERNNHILREGNPIIRRESSKQAKRDPTQGDLVKSLSTRTKFQNNTLHPSASTIFQPNGITDLANRAKDYYRRNKTSVKRLHTGMLEIRLEEERRMAQVRVETERRITQLRAEVGAMAVEERRVQRIERAKKGGMRVR